MISHYEELWKLADNKGQGIKVAMLDTGVEVKHPAFENIEIIPADLCGKNPGVDVDGHGTQCCGIISQVAPACTLLAGRTVVQSGSFTSDALLSGLFWARHKKADLICVCTGERVNDPDVDALITQLDSEGILVIAAIGNRGSSARNTGLFPARCLNSIAVGTADQRGLITDFTELPPEKKVVCLPGDSFVAPTIGGGYIEVTGTSMSAAYFAGLLALLKFQMKGYEGFRNAVATSCDARESPRGNYLYLDPVRLLSRAS